MVWKNNQHQSWIISKFWVTSSSQLEPTRKNLLKYYNCLLLKWCPCLLNVLILCLFYWFQINGSARCLTKVELMARLNKYQIQGPWLRSARAISNSSFLLSSTQENLCLSFWAQLGLSKNCAIMAQLKQKLLADHPRIVV